MILEEGGVESMEKGRNFTRKRKMTADLI